MVVQKQLAVDVYVSNEGQHFTAASDIFTYQDYTQLQVSAVLPSSGPDTGGTLVTIHGGPFANASGGQPLFKSQVRVKFGTEISNQTCTYVNASSLTCRAPKAATWNATTEQLKVRVVQVRVSFDDGQSFSTRSVNFLVHQTAQIQSLHPPLGDASGFTEVVVRGKNFQDTGTIVVKVVGRGCRDSFHKAGYWEYGIWMPPENCNAIVASVVATDGLCEKASWKRWVQTNCPLTCGYCLRDVFWNGTYINSTAIRFYMGPKTNLEPAYVNNVWVTRTMAIPHTQHVKISLNGQQYIPQTLNFLHTQQPIVSNLLPSSGPAYGGTIVTIMGPSLSMINSKLNRTVYSRFGSLGAKEIPAVFKKTGSRYGSYADLYETGQYITTAPPSHTPLSLTPASVSTEYTLNGRQWSQQTKQFMYYSGEVQVLTIKPLCGPLTGGTAVTVIGANFTDTGEILARFGYRRTGYFYSASLGACVYKSSTMVICTAPNTLNEYSWELQKTIQLSRRDVLVYISLNGQQWSKTHFGYQYYNSLNLVQATKIMPNFGPGPSGGTQLTITGTNFYKTGTAVCRLIKAGRVELARAEAQVVNATSMRCTSPRIALDEWAALAAVGATKYIAVEVYFNNVKPCFAAVS